MIIGSFAEREVGMKFLIVGLGNPGTEYTDTRHNIGFLVLDALAKELETSFSVQKLGDVAQGKLKGKPVVLVKPSTYMNLSGKSVHYWIQQEKIPLENILIITDDLALPYGKLRMKGKGSDGGHNGLKHIEEILKTQHYARLRFGIGNEFQKGRQVDYVLGKWDDEELKTLSEHLKEAVEFVKSFISIGIERTMNFHNKR